MSEFHVGQHVTVDYGSKLGLPRTLTTTRVIPWDGPAIVTRVFDTGRFGVHITVQMDDLAAAPLTVDGRGAFPVQYVHPIDTTAADEAAFDAFLVEEGIHRESSQAIWAHLGWVAALKYARGTK